MGNLEKANAFHGVRNVQAHDALSSRQLQTEAHF